MSVCQATPAEAKQPARAPVKTPATAPTPAAKQVGARVSDLCIFACANLACIVCVTVNLSDRHITCDDMMVFYQDVEVLIFTSCSWQDFMQ